MLALVPAVAAARTSKQYLYPVKQVWPAAVRHLRVNEGLRIVEKDPDAGYVVFELDYEGQTYHGALELVAVEDEQQGEITRAFLTITNRPAYMEEAILHRFETKIRDERGPPVARPKKKKPAEKKADDDKPK